MHIEVIAILSPDHDREDVESAVADLLEPYGEGRQWDHWTVLERPDAIRTVSDTGEIVPYAWLIDADAYGNEDQMPPVAPSDQVPSGWIEPELFTGRRFIPNPDFPSWADLRPFLHPGAWVVLLDCHN